jgi:hypothetical protein
MLDDFCSRNFLTNFDFIFDLGQRIGRKRKEIHDPSHDISNPQKQLENLNEPGGYRG